MLFNKMFSQIRFSLSCPLESAKSTTHSLIYLCCSTKPYTLYLPLQARRLASNVFKPYFHSQSFNFFQDKLLETQSFTSQWSSGSSSKICLQAFSKLKENCDSATFINHLPSLPQKFPPLGSYCFSAGRKHHKCTDFSVNTTFLYGISAEHVSLAQTQTRHKCITF